MSQLYNDQQDFNSTILIEAARALNIEPFELLMHPDTAFAYRRMRKDALAIAADNATAFREHPALDSLDNDAPKRKSR